MRPPFPLAEPVDPTGMRPRPRHDPRRRDRLRALRSEDLALRCALARSDDRP